MALSLFGISGWERGFLSVYQTIAAAPMSARECLEKSRDLAERILRHVSPSRRFIAVGPDEGRGVFDP